MGLTFFAEEPYVHSTKGRLMRGSSAIRGKQIAEYLGAKYNPTSGYDYDVCIYVKPPMKKDGSPLEELKGRPYIDILDYKEYIGWLKNDPNLSGIVASQYSYDILKKYRLPNTIVFIPQHHCNFERLGRNRQSVTTVGIIGAPRTFRYPIEDLKKKLDAIDLKLVTNFDFESREDVVDFYRGIDIQIIWDTVYRLLKNPLKIINAASFSIPTVGYPHKGYREVDGYYMKAATIDELVIEVGKLKDPERYDRAIKKLVPMAEEYHISKVAERYKELESSCI